MKALKLLTIISILLCSNLTNAQTEPIFGIKAGPNLRTAFLSGSDKDSYSAGMLIGFQIGGIIEIQQSDEFKLQSGLSILSKGHKLNDSYLGDFEKYTALYIQIPFSLFFKVSDYWMGGGPYFALATGGKRDYYGADVLAIGNTRDDDWAPLDIGLGLRGHRRVGPVDLGAEIEIGFLDSTPKGVRQTYDFHINNFNINFIAAYMFEK